MQMSTFRPRSADPAEDPEAVAWLRAVSQGFHQDRLTDEALGRSLQGLLDDGFTLRAVHDHDIPAPADPRRPVATFSSTDGTINAGAGRMLPARLITDVTVRPSHRRRGLLRTMMSAELAEAKAAGLPVAALTVTEGGIYRRFGFGPATFEAKIEVATDSRFALHTPPDGGGQVVLVDAAVLEEHAGEIFRRYHAQTLGSVQRFSVIPTHVSGLWDWSSREENRRVRGAIFVAESGEPEGYVAWEARRDPDEFGKITVRDLVPLTPRAYLALWDFLGHVDLIDSVRWGSAPTEDPLRFALTEPDLYRVRGLDANVWLRMLDVPAALTARAWQSTGSCVLAVEDSLDLVGGRYRIKIADGDAEVTRTDDEADAAMDAAALGSICLGGVRPSVLAAAGLIRELRPSVAASLDQLFAATGPVWGITHF
nr:GNAT family N-acetyltransferase [Naumannella cuiyingiana]